MKNYIHLFILLTLPAFSFAQQAKTLHQTFEIEEIERLNFNLYGEIEVEKWEGNTLLTETKIEVHDASKGIFNHYLNAGRYEIIIADKPSIVEPVEEEYELNDDYFSEDESTPVAEKSDEELINEAALAASEPIAPEPVQGGVYLTSKDTERKPIRTRTGECLEIIKVKIFIPEDFNQSGENQYFRVLPTEEDED